MRGLSLIWGYVALHHLKKQHFILAKMLDGDAKLLLEMHTQSPDWKPLIIIVIMIMIMMTMMMMAMMIIIILITIIIIFIIIIVIIIVIIIIIIVIVIILLDGEANLQFMQLQSQTAFKV